VSALVVPAVSAADIVHEAIEKTSQGQYRVYQVDIQNMGLGLYGGSTYNQGYRNRDGWASGVALFNPAWTDGGTPGNREARQYLVDQLAAMGLSVSVQGVYRNVVAELRGSERPEEIYIVCAHYDTTSVGERPGGDDNASGTAGVLEAARVLTQYNSAATLRFIGFNAEEDWMLGSQDYVNRVVLPGKEKIIGVLNLDMVLRPGWDSDPDRPVDLNIETRASTACLAWAHVFMDAIATYVPSLAVDPDSPTGFYWDAGDQGPFIAAGYPALMIAENTASQIWWYGSNAYYHQPGDADDAGANDPLGPSGVTYDYDFAVNVVRATVATLAEEASILPKPGHGFIEYQTIGTRGARDIEPFTMGGDHYVAVANGRDDLTYRADVNTYKWDGSIFVKQQSLPACGAADCAFFAIGNEHYLAIANLRDDATYRVDSMLYRWDGAGFVERQAIPTSGATDCEFFTIGGHSYLAFANSRTDAAYDVNSAIYRWDGTGFSEFQSIPTAGAADCEFFTIDDVPFLAIANAQNGDNYDVNSRVYRWDGAGFVELQALATQGAADWEFVRIGSDSYLVVANGYSGQSYRVDSRMYKWNGTSFVPYQILPTRGAAAWESFSLGGEVWLTVANRHDDATSDVDSTVYKWNGTRFVESLSIPTHGADDVAFFAIGEYPFLAVANSQDDATYDVPSAIYRYQMSPIDGSPQ
jgi:hypothetical protein